MCDNEPTYFTTVQRTARKQHKCVECHMPIIPSSKYEYIRGIWEGEWATFKTCKPCQELRAEVYDQGNECWEIGKTIEDAITCGLLASEA